MKILEVYKEMNEQDVNLTKAEEELTLQLQQKISAEIAKSTNGISFSRYMELALYDYEFGYYNNLLYKFGRLGDFITSPTLSPLFAATIANQIKELFMYLPNKNILEIGGGTGDLLLGIFAAIGDSIDKYYVLDLSANSVNYQKQRFNEAFPNYHDKIVWLNHIPNDFIGIILANEVLDAQPFDIINFTNNEICKRNVSLGENGEFVYVDANIDVICEGKLLNIAKSINISEKPYITEINLNNRGFMKTLASQLRTGAILLIDYGYGEMEYYAPHKKNGTLRGFFRHNLIESVLQYPGLIDITASVDFSAIATTGIGNGLDLIGYTTQANFLLNCGILAIHTDKEEDISAADFAIRSNQLNKLTSPNYMGDVFKVIGFSKNLDFSDWCGFSNNDRTHTL